MTNFKTTEIGAMNDIATNFENGKAFLHDLLGLTGCKYCYANATPAKAVENFKIHNKTSPILLGEIKETDTIQQGNQKSFIDSDKNLKLF